MGRGGQPKDRSEGPERKCIATGEAQPANGLIRFVVGPDGQIAPDIAGKLPGRGIWVSADRAALEKAAKKGLFARAARQPVTVPDDLLALVEHQEQATVLIQASDGSERGKTKLSTPHRGSFIGWLTASELGRAFGRQSAIHAALGAGGLAQRVVDEAARLKGLRVLNGEQTRRKGSRTR